MSAQHDLNTAKRRALRLGWMSAISFLVAAVLMCLRHEWMVWGSFGFAFMGVVLSGMSVRLNRRLMWPELVEEQEKVA